MPPGIWDQIPAIGWNLIIRDESEISEFSSQMGEQGTIVVIEHLDRVIDSDDEKKAKSKFYRIAGKTEKHLALTFHRFIEEDDLILELNGNPIKAWNPFIWRTAQHRNFLKNRCFQKTAVQK